MKKVLVYENDQVNEYDVEFDQEYMDILLEEYRKSYAYLREGSVLSCGKCSKDAILNMIHYFDEVVSFGVSATDIDKYYQLSFIGAINPVAYNLLKDSDNKFDLNNRKMHSLLYWAEALEHRSEEHKKRSVCEFAPVNDFLGKDEGFDTVNNLSSLFEDITLVYSGKKENPTASEVELSQVASRFIEKFNVVKEMPKAIKKGV